MDMATAKKLLMFSMHLKAIVLVLTFFTDPGIRVFTNLLETKSFLRKLRNNSNYAPSLAVNKSIVIKDRGKDTAR